MDLVDEAQDSCELRSITVSIFVMGNVFDYHGPDFLVFYAQLVAAGFVVGFLIRYFLRLPGGSLAFAGA